MFSFSYRHRYQSTLTLRQPLEKDNGNYTVVAHSGSHTAQFSFNIKVKGEDNQEDTHRDRQIIEHAR